MTVSGTTTAAKIVAAPAATSVITGPATAASTTAAPAGRVHTVVSGDTIISIALANDMDWRQLLQLNGLTDKSVLQIGQEIRLE